MWMCKHGVTFVIKHSALPSTWNLWLVVAKGRATLYVRIFDQLVLDMWWLLKKAHKCMFARKVRCVCALVFFIAEMFE
jgi:hypothetical protein